MLDPPVAWCDQGAREATRGRTCALMMSLLLLLPWFSRQPPVSLGLLRPEAVAAAAAAAAVG